MKNDTFGFFLRDLREQNGLSQSQLGRLAGVSDKAVSKWENDTARPQSRLLYRLASVLGVTVDELLSCRRRPPENKGEGVCKMKDGLWKQAHHALRVPVWGSLPVGVLNRYLSEFEALRMTDAILCFELLRRISVRPRRQGSTSAAAGISLKSAVPAARRSFGTATTFRLRHCRKRCTVCVWTSRSLMAAVKQCGKRFARFSPMSPSSH